MFFLGLFLIAAGTLRADGDDVLDRLIRLPKMKGTVYALLGKVSECSGYLFVYDSKKVNNEAVERKKGKECTERQPKNGKKGNKTNKKQSFLNTSNLKFKYVINTSSANNLLIINN